MSGSSTLSLLIFSLALSTLMRAGAAKAAEDEGWDRSGPIIEAASTNPTDPHAPLRVQVGEVENLVGHATIRQNNSEKPRILKKGDKIYVGDQIAVEYASAVEVAPAKKKTPPKNDRKIKPNVELTLGLNVRLRIGSDSILRIKSVRQYPVVNGVRKTKRSVELEKGTARVRVRENTRSPSPVELIVSGTVTLLLNGSDAVATRDDSQATLRVLRGRALLQMKRGEPNDLRTVEKVQVASQEKVIILQKEIRKLPKPEKMSAAEFAKAKKKIIFSVDNVGLKRPPALPRDQELDQP